MTPVNLFVNRLYVLTEQNLVAYDERFHHGVNIIRGDNSSGKSTLTHLLFYALGGDSTSFVAEVYRCSRVMVEVSLGNVVVTLSRPLEKDGDGRVKSRQGMTLYWGTLDDALEQRCHSHSFDYDATAGKEGFSAMLFRLMDMPPLQADCDITMHQLLRLIYVDQESPTWAVFLYDQFDSQATRETVADLLMGIYDSKFYEAKALLRKLTDDIADTRASVRSIEATLPPGQRSSDAVRALIEDKKDEIARYADDINRLRAGECLDVGHKPLLEQQKTTVAMLARERNRVEEKVELLEYEIEDTRLFIEELVARQEALGHSFSARRVLGNLQLAFCPECLSPLPADVPEGTCCLCKSPVQEQSGATQARRMTEELAFQIQESRDTLKHDEEQLTTLRARMKDLHHQHEAACRALDQSLGAARGTYAGQLEDLHYRQGCAQGELLQYYTLLEHAEYYERQVALLGELQARYAGMESSMREHVAFQEQGREEVRARIQEHGVYFLHRDKECQRAFANAQPEDFHIDFSAGTVYLRRPHDRFSASSSFFLKVVARLALFLASLDIPRMRYPRFILVDSMEDKGIEVARTQKFQKTLISRLEQYPADSYQVIYTTSCITEELDHSHYVVGGHYSMHNKSLHNV